MTTFPYVGFTNVGSYLVFANEDDCVDFIEENCYPLTETHCFNGYYNAILIKKNNDNVVYMREFVQDIIVHRAQAA